MQNLCGIEDPCRSIPSRQPIYNKKFHINVHIGLYEFRNVYYAHLARYLVIRNCVPLFVCFIVYQTVSMGTSSAGVPIQNNAIVTKVTARRPVAPPAVNSKQIEQVRVKTSQMKLILHQCMIQRSNFNLFVIINIQIVNSVTSTGTVKTSLAGTVIMQRKTVVQRAPVGQHDQVRFRSF